MPDTNQKTGLCDCERSHNGLGMVGRECDCLYEEYYEDGDRDCDHSDAEIDILTGEMSCRCGYSRYLSGDELRREAAIQAEAMETYYRECEQTERDAKVAT